MSAEASKEDEEVNEIEDDGVKPIESNACEQLFVQFLVKGSHSLTTTQTEAFFNFMRKWFKSILEQQ